MATQSTRATAAACYDMMPTLQIRPYCTYADGILSYALTV